MKNLSALLLSLMLASCIEQIVEPEQQYITDIFDIEQYPALTDSQSISGTWLLYSDHFDIFTDDRHWISQEGSRFISVCGIQEISQIVNEEESGLIEVEHGLSLRCSSDPITWESLSIILVSDDGIHYSLPFSDHSMLNFESDVSATGMIFNNNLPISLYNVFLEFNLLKISDENLEQATRKLMRHSHFEGSWRDGAFSNRIDSIHEFSALQNAKIESPYGSYEEAGFISLTASESLSFVIADVLSIDNESITSMRLNDTEEGVFGIHANQDIIIEGDLEQGLISTAGIYDYIPDAFGNDKTNGEYFLNIEIKIPKEPL